ncbi:methylation-associated defense system AAA family ATPase MAD3 [Nannocystaceae bacterium ST9]
MITRIEATNYRCFEQVGAPFDDFQVVAGANGSGKTTLLDIPVVLGDMLRGRNIAAAFMERVLERGARAGSLTELPYIGRETFALALEAKLPTSHVDALVEASSEDIRTDTKRWPTHLRYEVRLEIDEGHQLEVHSEYLFAFPPSDAYEAGRLAMQGENGNDEDWRFIIRRNHGRGGAQIDGSSRHPSDVEFRPELARARGTESQIDRTKLALARLAYETPTEFPAGRWLLELLLDGVVFFEPQWAELRRPSPPGLPRRLMPSGENLPWLALQLQSERPEQFAAWVEHVRTGLPQIVGIGMREREEDHHAYFKVDYEGGFEVTSTGLSEGTLRILALTLVAYVLDPPRLLIIEEPENSIHPQALETIMQSLRSLYDSQVWVSTHSPVVLAGCELGELLITRLERSGSARVIPGPEHPRLAAWKGAIDLGSLFASGVFE